MNQSTDTVLILKSLISFRSQQQQVPNSSAHNTPHSEVGDIANAGDSTHSVGIAPVNQITGLNYGGVGISPQGDNSQ